MADHFPNDPMQYFEKFKMMWQYIQTYLIDHEYGDWYEEGLDNKPGKKNCIKRTYLESNLSSIAGIIELCAKASGQD